MSIKTKAEWEKISSDLSFRSEAFINGKFVKIKSNYSNFGNFEFK